MTSRPTAAAATVAATAFDAVARVRHRKPLHPRGLVVPAVLERNGLARPLGASWLDEPGLDEGVARLSRSAGLPDGWPDVWGLALRLAVAGGSAGPADLLLAGSFAARVGRHVLALRRGPQGPMSCLLPYRTAGGSSVLVGVPARSRAMPSSRGDLAARLAREPLTVELAATTPGGSWQPFGVLTVGGAVTGTGDGADEPDQDAEISFDPVLNPLPGLRLPDPLATIRERAYEGARAGRHAQHAALHRLPAPR